MSHDHKVMWSIILLYAQVTQLAGGQQGCKTAHLPTRTATYDGNRAMIPSGESVVLRCKGHYHEGNTTTICLDGMFTKPDPPCKYVECHNISIPNGYLDYERQASVNIKAFIICHSGFEHTGVSVLVCQRSGQWTSQDGQCKNIAHVSCDPIKGAHIQARDQPGSYLSNLTIKCEPGYEYNGTQTRICQLNNTWSGVDGMCILRHCHKPEIGNGHIEMEAKTFYEVGSSVNVGCNIGFELQGARRITCSKNYQWTNHGKCKIIKCSTTVLVANGHVAVTDHVFGTFGKLHCNEGFQVEGNSSVKCGANGLWMIYGECKEIPSAIRGLPWLSVLAILPIIAASIIVGVRLKKQRQETPQGTENPPEAGAPLLIPFPKEVHTDFNKKAIINRGQAIGRCNDKLIDIRTQFIDLRLVGSPLEKLTESVSRNQYQSHLELSNVKDIELDELLQILQDVGFILFCGRAGVGKTTLLYKIMDKWANNELPHHDLALMFSTRYLSKMQQMEFNRGITLGAFLEKCSLHEVQLPEDWSSKYASGHFKMLVCIDGIDEFQSFIARISDSRSLSPSATAEPYQWCISILRRDVLQESTLLITSRHFKGLKLLPPQKSMDIVGLEKSKIKEYIDTHVSPENKTRVQNAIFTNPIMLSVSTITFFCMMLCRALEDADGSISIDQDLHTYTRITSFIFKNLIGRNICLRDEALPEANVKSCITKLSRLAYQGLAKNMYDTGVVQLVFSDEDLVGCGIKNEDKTFGIKLGLIIQKEYKYAGDQSRKSTFTEFIHLSVQEILAMAHLLHQDQQTIEKAFRRMWKSEVFTVALPHLFGLCYDDHWYIKELIENTSDGTNSTVCDVKQVLFNVLTNGKKPHGYQRLCAIQMAYESDNPEIAAKVVELIYGENDTVTFNDMALTAVDLNGIRFAAKHSKCICKLELRRLKNGNSCLTELEQILAEDRIFTAIGFNGTAISEPGLTHLLNALKKNSTISTLSLEATSLNDPMMVILAAFLEKNTSIKNISLAQNDISASGVATFSKGIRNNSVLESVTFDTGLGEDSMNILRTLQQDSDVQVLLQCNGNTRQLSDVVL